MHLYFLEKLSKKPGVALFLPWEPPSFYYNKNTQKTILRIIMHSRYLAYYRYFYLNRLAGTAYFIIGRSALLHSFLKLPIVKQVMNWNMYLKPYQIKTIMYKQGGFLSKPQKGKFTGFDKMKTVLLEKYGLDYNKAFRYPLSGFISSSFLKELDLYISPLWEDKADDFLKKDVDKDKTEISLTFKESLRSLLYFQKRKPDRKTLLSVN